MVKQRVGVAVLLFALAGCSSAARWPEFSGFLSDYKGMYRSNDVKGLFIIKHRGKNVGDYSKFLVDPITVQLTPDAEGFHIDKGELEVIAKTFRKDIISALQTQYTVVEDPGEGVLRLRVAITDILKRYESGSVKALVEAEFIDTSTQDQIAAAMTSGKGIFLTAWAELLKERLIYLNSKVKSYQFK